MYLHAVIAFLDEGAARVTYETPFIIDDKRKKGPVTYIREKYADNAGIFHFFHNY